MGYLLGIDLGTSSLRAALIERTGKTVAIAGREYPILTPHKDWAEQDPNTGGRHLNIQYNSYLNNQKLTPVKSKELDFQDRCTVLLLLTGQEDAYAMPFPGLISEARKNANNSKQRSGRKDYTG